VDLSCRAHDELRVVEADRAWRAQEGSGECFGVFLGDIGGFWALHIDGGVFGGDRADVIGDVRMWLMLQRLVQLQDYSAKSWLVGLYSAYLAVVVVGIHVQGFVDQARVAKTCYQVRAGGGALVLRHGEAHRAFG